MKRAVLPRSRMLLMMMNIKRDVLRRRISVEVERGVIVLTQRRADYSGDRDCTDIRRAGVFQPLKQARLDVTDVFPALGRIRRINRHHRYHHEEQ